jgi:IclR family KDG regulon transcriptional repressor
MNTVSKLPKEATKPIESVDKALEIMMCFSDQEPILSLKQLSEKTGFHKSGILRLCGTLLARGFLVRSRRSVYSLGPVLLRLGKIYERNNSLISLARPILHELSAMVGESTKLFGIQGNRRVCLAIVKESHPLSYTVEEGEEFDLHAGSAGLVLLAFSSKEFRNKVLQGWRLQNLTPYTIVDRDQLEKTFKRIRKHGYSISRGELLPEVAGISAPVFDHISTICASISISGPVQRFADFHCKEMLKHLLSSAEKQSAWYLPIDVSNLVWGVR